MSSGFPHRSQKGRGVGSIFRYKPTSHKDTETLEGEIQPGLTTDYYPHLSS